MKCLFPFAILALCSCVPNSIGDGGLASRDASVVRDVFNEGLDASIEADVALPAPDASGMRDVLITPDVQGGEADVSTGPSLSVRAESLGTLSIAAHGIAVSSDGTRLYISDSFSQQQRRIHICPFALFNASDCQFFTHPAIQTPAGLSVFDDKLYISDVQSGRVLAFNESTISQSGLDQAVVDIEIRQVWNSERVGDHFMSVTNDGQIVEWNAGESLSVQRRALFDPFDIAPGQNGYWVSEQSSASGAPGQLSFLNTQGQTLLQINDDLQNPEGLAPDEAGGVWVAETQLNELRLYDANGALIYRDTLTFSTPVALQSAKSALDPNSDDLVLFDVGSGRVFRIIVERQF